MKSTFTDTWHLFIEREEIDKGARTIFDIERETLRELISHGINVEMYLQLILDNE